LELVVGRGEAEEARDAVVSLAGVVEQRKGALEEGEGGADRWGPGVSDRGKKKRREGDGGRCGEGRNGSVGRWAERGRLGSFFKNPFQIKPFEFKFKSNLFKVFHNIL
jgi:hypothetical protein